MDSKDIELKNKILIEVAVEGIEQAVQAEQLGADRIELCADLKGGGITPSAGMIRACTERLSIPIHVMIRPRRGNFCYSEAEFNTMQADIDFCHKLGVQGVVFGLLNENGHLDLERLKTLKQRCDQYQLKTTFHRALDVCTDMDKAVEILIDLNFDNVLTSGGEPKAIDGLTKLRQWQDRYGNQINIMAGSGIHGDNIRSFVKSGIRNIHFTSYRIVRKGALNKFDFEGVANFDHEKMQGIVDALHT